MRLLFIQAQPGRARVESYEFRGASKAIVKALRASCCCSLRLIFSFLFEDAMNFLALAGKSIVEVLCATACNVLTAL
jgi:hypothetical protein